MRTFNPTIGISQTLCERKDIPPRRGCLGDGGAHILGDLLEQLDHDIWTFALLPDDPALTFALWDPQRHEEIRPSKILIPNLVQTEIHKHVATDEHVMTVGPIEP